MPTTPTGFGLIIVGGEILDGRRPDSHFAFARQLLEKNHLVLRYCLVLPDDFEIIESHILWSFARPEPFFCCGGIGATPDDLTRQAAAAAAGVPLEFHPEGVKIITSRFGKGVTEARLRLVEFPKGAALVPNPFNQVPGFAIRNGYFLPGFPEMAQPMMAWVLATHYGPGAERSSARLLLPGAREGDLVPLMEEFVPAHPGLSFSSLPRFTDTGGTEVELGLSGLTPSVQAGLSDLKAMLDKARVKWVE